MGRLDIIQRQQILSKSSGICAHCGVELDLKSFTIDHYIPKSKGGTNVMSNLIPLCGKCNKTKDNLIVEPRQAYPYINIKYENQLRELYFQYIDKQTRSNNEKTKKSKVKRKEITKDKELKILRQSEIKIAENIDLSNIELDTTNSNIMKEFLSK